MRIKSFLIMLALAAMCFAQTAAHASWSVSDAFTGNSAQWQLGSLSGGAFSEYVKNDTMLSSLTGGG